MDLRGRFIRLPVYSKEDCVQKFTVIAQLLQPADYEGRLVLNDWRRDVGL